MALVAFLKGFPENQSGSPGGRPSRAEETFFGLCDARVLQTLREVCYMSCSTWLDSSTYRADSRGVVQYLRHSTYVHLGTSVHLHMIQHIARSYGEKTILKEVCSHRQSRYSTQSYSLRHRRHKTHKPEER
ncbi:hypothetical protein BO78DRAFT_99641 [Aspergillus sclerotiicarbonarius CBS 121057]|uniref:Uncharacterized protein n=1 Tax=Aspergillus sclerotiicarbonarius (strain CBS 121057 / IBT 28362) TaxID=1448318 RepID=A0A319F1T6_ASPSB|nr:hypothetical protein BO78DRAFT_99641 [Aspergillus sclerotiicarbonarius CBS 121057]